MNFKYPATIQKGEGGFFLVTFRDFPFAATEGQTHEEAMREATDCLEEAVAVCIDERIPLYHLPEEHGKMYRYSSPIAYGCQSSSPQRRIRG